MQETWVQSLSREDPWRREWLPTPVFWPGEFHGQGSLAGYSPWGCKQSDTTKWLSLSRRTQATGDLASQDKRSRQAPLIPSFCLGLAQWFTTRPSTVQEEGKYFKYTDKSYLFLQRVILTEDIKPRSFKMSQFFYFFNFPSIANLKETVQQ